MKRINKIASNIRSLLFWQILSWSLIAAASFAQEGRPFFRNFTAEEYQAHNRNFDVVCDSLGIVYFANFEGVIYYNGVKWQKLLTPGISRITHLMVDKKGAIWAGGHNFIGKMEASANGTPYLRPYVSDSDSLNHDTRIGDILLIEEKENNPVFYTRNLKISIIDDSIHTSPLNEPLNVDESLSCSIAITPYIYFESNGIDGVNYSNQQTKESKWLTEREGLCSNHVNKMAYDQRGSIWGATDNGIFQLNVPSFFSYFDSHDGLQGEILSICHHGSFLYVGTSQGLFIYNPDTDQFDAIPLIKQSCWDLVINFNNDLYAVTSNGLFSISGKTAKPINSYNTFSLLFDPKDSKRYYTGEIDGIYQYQNGKRIKISDVENVMRIILAHNYLWAETLYGEIYKSTKDLRSIQLQNISNGLNGIGGNKLSRINGTVYVFSPNGVYSWDDTLGQFVSPECELNTFIQTSGWWPGLVSQSSTNDNKLLLVGGDSRRLLAIENLKPDSLLNSKFSMLDNLSIRTIYEDKDSIIWIGSNARLIKIDLKRQDKTYTQTPKIYIRSVRIGMDSTYWGGDNAYLKQNPSSRIPVFKSQTRNFSFEFSTENTNAVRPSLYAYRLEGANNLPWSDWGTNTEQNFNNLPYGAYTFHVKALDGFGRESEETTFSFKIEKPYYLQWYSIISYILILGVLVSLYAKWRNRKLLIEKMRLEALVEQRTEQIRTQRDEIIEKSQKLETTLVELKEAQDQLIQQEKVATVGKLTQGLIDRILNPLNYIINFSHLSTVLLKDMDEDLRDEKENISEDNFEDMQEISGMLHTHLSKIEEHGNSTSRILKAMEEMLSDHSCHYAETDLNKLILNNINVLKEFYKKEIEETNINILFNNPSPAIIIDLDPVQIGKVLMSMMQNCIYALRKKQSNGIAYKALMKISLYDKGNNVQIGIWDNGVGIEDTIVKKIFDPFFTTKTTSEAAGVGLYLSREIILNHNGQMDVHSEKNEYTEFILTIPKHQSINSKKNEGHN